MDNSTNTQTLLERARELERQPKVDSVTGDQMDMAIAWAEGEVSAPACARALGMGKKTAAVLPLLARFLQAALRDGRLKKVTKRSE